jgi:hypothetical protein
MKISVLAFLLLANAVCPADSDPTLKKQVEEMWTAGNFQGLEESAEICRCEKMDILDYPRITSFYAALRGNGIASDEDAASKLAKFDKWRAAIPYSVTAKVALADFHITDAWRARGTGWASTVSAEGWRLFKERLIKAREILYSPDIEIRLDPMIPGLRIVLQMAGFPPPAPRSASNYQLLLRRLLGYLSFTSYAAFHVFEPTAAEPQQDITRHSREAYQWWPNYFPIYQNTMHALLPRWGGSPHDGALFAAQTAARFPGKQGDGVYAMLARTPFDAEGMTFFQESGFDTAKLLRGLDVLASEGAKNWRPFSAQRAAFVASVAGNPEDARRRIFAIGPATIPSAYLTYDEVLPAWTKCGAVSELQNGVALERDGKLAEAEAFYDALTPAQPNPWIQPFALRNGVGSLWKPPYGSPSPDLPVEQANPNQLFELASFHLCAGNLDQAKVYAEAFDQKRGHNITGKFTLAFIAVVRGDKTALAELKTRFLSLKTDRESYRHAQDYVSGKVRWQDLRSEIKPDEYFVQACSIMACFALGEGRTDEAKNIFEEIHRRMPFSTASAFAESMLWGALHRQFPNALDASASSTPSANLPLPRNPENPGS